MPNESETPTPGRQTDAELLTGGHVERTVLHYLTGDGEPYRPATVSDILGTVEAVIERGGYANIGPRGTADAIVRKSTIRRTFNQLREKGLVQRVSELDAAELRADRYDLGTLDGDPSDPASYSRTSDDARVTDWALTREGRHEVDRLDERYVAELDDFAARYGRPRGETTRRVEG